MSWCSEDPGLLISCGKDNRLLIWNPSSETDVIFFLFYKDIPKISKCTFLFLGKFSSL